MVEIISPPNSPILLAFRQLIAVRKFGRRSLLTGRASKSNTEAVLRDFSRCVRRLGLSRKRWKIVTIADHSNQKSYVLQLWRLFSSVLSRDKGGLNWHQRRRTCWVLRRVGWRSACCHQQCAAAVRHAASPQLLSSFHWGSAARDDGFGCQKFRSRQEQWKLETIGVTQPLWKISGYATGPT